jgi:RimJ/RimL family protein N-acetyltransferase
VAELRTPRLLLRPWAPGDEEALVRHANNWKVARNLRDVFPHPYTQEDARRWIERNAAIEGPTLDFALVLDGEAVGSVGLIPRSDILRCSIEVGYWLAEPFWGRGLVPEAVAAVVGYAFATFPDVTVVVAHHLASNPASGRVLEKCGFRLDGRLRQAAIKNGVVQDLLLYSRTRASLADERDGAGERPRP